MSKKEKKTESIQSTGSTQANTPSWIQNGHQTYMQGVNDLMGKGADAFTPAGPNQLQQTAFNNAQNLTTSPWYSQAAGMASQAGNAGANTATATGYQGQGYTAAQGQATNAQAANAGQAQGYNPNTVDWSKFGVEGVNVGPMAQGSSRNITDLDLNSYLNAGLGDQITAAQADYDATGGRVRAAQSGQAALNGGARNSNNAVMQAITEGELSRAANTGIANVRANAYDQAGNLATNDLNREASMSQFNAGQTNQGTLTQAQLNAQRNSLQAQLGQTGLLANQNALNQAGQFNAGAQNDFSLANAGFSQQANLANAGAANQFGLANMDSLNQAGQFGANAQNQANQFNAGAQNQTSQFNAGQQDSALARQLQAAGLLGNLGQAESADQRANIGTQADLGQQQYQMQLMQQQYPLQFQQIMQSLSGFNPGLYAGSTDSRNTNSTSTTKTSDPLGSLGALMQGAGSLFSPIKIPGFS